MSEATPVLPHKGQTQTCTGPTLKVTTDISNGPTMDLLSQPHGLGGSDTALLVRSETHLLLRSMSGSKGHTEVGKIQEEGVSDSQSDVCTPDTNTV